MPLRDRLNLLLFIKYTTPFILYWQHFQEITRGASNLRQ
jgi:hypothetical protein